MELSNQEKIDIVSSYLKNCYLNIYNLEISLMLENSIQEKNETNINNINLNIEKENSRVSVLLKELEGLQNG